MPATDVSLGMAGRCGVLAMNLLLAACSDGGYSVGGTPAMGGCLRTQTPTMAPAPAPGAPPAGIALRLDPINVSLTFPLFLTAPSGDMNRLFVVEKGGLIKIVNRANNALIGTFLDISNLVSAGGEQGLLGLAFDPQYATNRRFYVSYTDKVGVGNSVVARYLADPNNPNVALTAADSIIITQAQPFENHNGGMIAFGPDNYLYIGLGDGGSGGDPFYNGQNTGVLLGKLLRIDVNTDDFPNDANRNYGVPSSNPCVGQAGVAGEIWSFGLRNPWRYSFDRQSGDIYVADVGQGLREEVNVSTSADGAGRGINYGWNVMEGSLCYSPGAGCSMTGLTLPAVEYDHGSGCSITGGYAYRGTLPALQTLRGTYFYGDFCAGFVRSFRLVNGVVTEHADWPLFPGNITSFGEDAAGELYIMTSSGGLYRIVPN
jgi:glucose/arabinose dehydrogenase